MNWKPVCGNFLTDRTILTFLRRAYIDPSIRLAFILGIGVNAAIHSPVVSLHPSEIDGRP